MIGFIWEIQAISTNVFLFKHKLSIDMSFRFFEVRFHPEKKNEWTVGKRTKIVNIILFHDSLYGHVDIALP